MIERRNREVCGAEPPLREQGAEDVDRLVAALHRLGQVHSRPESGLRALDTRVRLVDRRRERSCVGRFALCALDGVLEGQGRLCQSGIQPRDPISSTASAAHMRSRTPVTVSSPRSTIHGW